jgi:hypothetical protein
MYDYDLFNKKSLRSFSSSSSTSKFGQNSLNKFSTANTSKNDSLILPYYQSEKWVKLLKKKVSNIANEYNEFLNLQYEKIKNKANNNKNSNKNNNNNINFPLIEYKNINIENNNNNNNFNLFEQNIYEPGMKFEEINKLQKCSLQKMFPKFRNKTMMNFYSAKNRNAKMKKISLFDNNNLNINSATNKEEGIQANAKTFYASKESLKKQQYIDYIKQKSENDYMKFYYNCYG